MLTADTARTFPVTRDDARELFTNPLFVVSEYTRAHTTSTVLLLLSIIIISVHIIHNRPSYIHIYCYYYYHYDYYYYCVS